MNKKIIIPILGLASTLVSAAALADIQTILPSTTNFSVSSGETVQFAVTYPEGNPEATGLGVTLYFDSSKLTFVETTDVLSTPNLHQVQDPSDDTADSDGDADTDQKIVVAFANFTSDPFVATEDMPADLFTVNFTATDDISSGSTINFTGSPAAGHTFASTPVSITYSDDTAPSITAPADVTITASSSSTSVTSTELGDPTVSDDSDESPSVTYSPQGPFAVGTHTITWTATDSSNNSSSDTQTLTIADTEAPTITAPADVSTPATGTTTAVTLGTPTVSDNTDSAPTVTADNSGPFSLGVNTVTWTATDASGNSATDEQTVTVTDDGAPSVTAPSDITKEATGATTPVTLGVASALDAVDGSIAATADNTGPFAVGVHSVTWTATDTEGNSATAVQTVTITDTTVPTITLPADITQEATDESTQIDIGTATATDLVDGEVSVSSDSEGSFSVGTNSVTWTATDSAGNTITAIQTIIITDGEGPEVIAPADISVEATGSTTSVSLGDATATDTVDGDITATADNEGPFTVGAHTITWTATDSAGNVATDTQTVTVEDTTAPVISLESATIELNATGVITPFTNAGVTATDVVDGSTTVTGFELIEDNLQALSDAGFTSGTHLLVWESTDNAGNTSSVTQTLNITPQANFANTQAASAGDEVTVSVELSGEAVSYPVTIPYSIDTQLSTVANDGSDHDASDGNITIESGTSGSFTFNVAANPVTDKGDLIFNLGTLSNAIAGAITTHKVIISADNIAPSIEVQMTQGGVDVTKVVVDAGNVTISAIATDSLAQTLSYDWSQSDITLTDLFADSDDATFELDPSSLEAGLYNVIVVVSDDGSPIGETTIKTSFKVVAGSNPVADSDHDGVEDDEDHVSEGHRLPGTRGASDEHILESEPGTRLTLGGVARDQDKNAAGIDNTDLPEVPAEYEDIALGIYDFEITGVAQGESALIVIPQDAAIPADAVYLKSDGTTWREFVEDDNNALYSAAEIGSGVCPSPGDASYVSGLNAGDHCVQLKIEDGGANDTDGLVNGSVADPGVIVEVSAIASTPGSDTGTDTSDTGSSTSDTGTSTSGGGGTLSWFFMPFLLLLGLLKKGFVRRR